MTLQPQASQPLIQLSVIPAKPALLLSQERQVVYLLVEAKPPELPGSKAHLPLNLALVLDRSSSMRGERLFQVKEAAAHIINELNERDFFSLVVFNDRAEVVIPAQHVIEKAQLRNNISQVEARGGTEMATGLDLGIQELERAMVGRCISQLILLTDGRTYGDDSRCVELARGAQQRGIGITALGVGNEWNEDLLETIAARENSRTEYITSAQEIFAVFADELKRLRSVVAQSVELHLLAVPGSQIRSVYRVQPFISPMTLSTMADQHWKVPLGDWASFDSHALLIEMALPPMPAGQQTFLRLDLRYVLPTISTQPLRTHTDISLPVLPAEQQPEAVEGTVRYWLERTVAHRQQALAWEKVANGDLEDATRRLRMAGTRLLEAGEVALAQTVQDEATRLLRSGSVSDEGRKKIRYGTRGLVAQSNE